jgi:hypothetical protein
MADQEVIKHTKKVYKVWMDRDHSFGAKLKEFGIEVFIIVFAVSLSIWFHDLSEHRHQQRDVRDFLIGIRGDLINDTLAINQGKARFLGYADAYTYLSRLKMAEPVSKDSFARYQPAVFDITAIIAHDGRFEGFKSSGKIGTIEDDALQNDIVDLYQDDLNALKADIDFYNIRKEGLFDYILKNNVRVTDSTSNIRELFKKDECRNLCWALSNVNDVSQQSDVCLNRMRSIIREINKLYPEKPAR